MTDGGERRNRMLDFMDTVQSLINFRHVMRYEVTACSGVAITASLAEPGSDAK